MNHQPTFVCVGIGHRVIENWFVKAQSDGGLLYLGFYPFRPDIFYGPPLASFELIPVHQSSLCTAWNFVIPQ